MQQLAELLQNVPGIKSIDLKDVKRLAQLLRETPEIGSIEVKGWFGTGVVITRTTGRRPCPPVRGAGAASALRPHLPRRAGASEARPRPRRAAAQLKEIRSPMVGTFYKAPEPGAEPYIKVGNRVTRARPCASSRR